MPRLMSVAFTEQAVRDRRKTVTRRRGWAFLKPGDKLTLCRKVMGRRKGEPLVRIAEVEVVSVGRQPLDLLAPPVGDPAYGAEEMAREGFPGMDPREFIRKYFVEAQGMDPAATVTRIEWKYLPEHRCICTSEHCYGDIYETPVEDLCFHCNYDWAAFEDCPERHKDES